MRGSRDDVTDDDPGHAHRCLCQRGIPPHYRELLHCPSALEIYKHFDKESVV